MKDKDFIITCTDVITKPELVCKEPLISNQAGGPEVSLFLHTAIYITAMSIQIHEEYLVLIRGTPFNFHTHTNNNGHTCLSKQ